MLSLVYINGRMWICGATELFQSAANGPISWRPALIEMPFDMFCQVKTVGVRPNGRY